METIRKSKENEKGNQMNTKSLRYFSLIWFLGIAAILSFHFYNRNQNEEWISIKKEIQSMIMNIKNNSILLNHTINDVDIPLNKDVLSSYKIDAIDKKSLALLDQIDENPKYNSKKNKKILNSLFLLRQSLVQYNLAIHALEKKSYQEAKIKLSMTERFLFKAEEEIKVEKKAFWISLFQK